MREDWNIISIDEACNVEYGTRVVKKRDEGTIYPVYGGGGATFNLDQYNRENRMVISRFAMSEQCTRFVSGKFFLNDSGLTISPKNEVEIEKRFLNYQILSLNDQIYSMGRGTAQRNLNVDDFRKLKIRYPKNKFEQKRIVAILNEAFEAIDKAKANVERNIENAEELFQSKLNEIFSQRGEGWVTEKLSNVFKMKSGDQLSKKNVVPGPYPVYGGNGITAHHHEYNLEGQQVLIGRVGAQCGNIHLTNDKIWLTDNAFKVTELKYEFDYEFLEHLLRVNDLRQTARQTAQPVISNSSCKNVLLVFPESKSSQKEIAEHVNELDTEVLKIIESYKAKLIALEELKKSILQKAFSGELTANETVAA